MLDSTVKNQAILRSILYYSRENNSEVDIMINPVDIRIKVDIMKHLTNIFWNHLKDLVTQ